jgi:hypothetical protein
MYQDFEDLRDNCPTAIRAAVAVDFEHADPARLAAAWPATADGEFRLALVQAVTDFWEGLVRARGRVPEDGFAIEITVDSYSDPEMGSSLYLDLRAYCGTEGVGDLAWQVFEDDALERKFAAEMATRIPALLETAAPGHGLTCAAEVDEVEEL